MYNRFNLKSIVISCSTYSRDHTQLWSHGLFYYETNTLVCDFKNSTQRFKSSTVVDLMQQLYSIAKSIVCTRSPTITSKWFEKTPDLCTKNCPLEYVKKFSRVCIYISLRFIKTLDPMDEKESENSNLHDSRLVEMCISISRNKWDFSTLIFSYFLEYSIV